MLPKSILVLLLCAFTLGCGGSEKSGSSETTIALSSLSLKARDIEFKNGLLYIAVASDSPSHSNEFVGIDPTTKEFVRSVPVGDDPQSICLTDDGNTAYVGLKSASEVRKVNVNDETVSVAYTIPARLGTIPRFALDLAIVPGTTDHVVTLFGDTNSNQDGLMVNVSGVFTGNELRASALPTSIAFGSDPSKLYGYGVISGGDSSIISIAGDEATLDLVNFERNGYASSVERYSGGIVHSNGVIQRLTDLQPIGSFAPGIPTENFAAHLVSESRNRAYFLFGNKLQVFDLTTRQRIRTFKLYVGGNGAQPLDTGFKLAPYGTRGIAIIDQENRLSFLDDAG